MEQIDMFGSIKLDHFRICSQCKIKKPLNLDFFSYVRKGNYYFKRCKVCANQAMQETRNKKRESGVLPYDYHRDKDNRNRKRKQERLRNKLKIKIKKHGSLSNYLLWDSLRIGKKYNDVLKRIKNIEISITKSKKDEIDGFSDRFVILKDVLGNKDFAYVTNFIFGERCWRHFTGSGVQYLLKYNLDTEFNAKERLRRQIRKAKNRDGIASDIRLAVFREGNSKTVEAELGFTIKEFCSHFESLFTDNMNWQEFKNGNIHIDHERPQDSFDLTKQNEWEKCWSLENLQPLWAKENLEKGNKLNWRRYEHRRID